MSQQTRALCRQTVSKVLGNGSMSSEERRTALLDVVNKATADGNPDFGQLRVTLSPVGECTDAYQAGVSAYTRTMARTGNHPRALRAACRHAGLEPPAEDVGPIDRLFNRVQASLDDRPGRNGTPPQRLNTPSTHRH